MNSSSDSESFTHDNHGNCDRAELLIRRAVNCEWITVHDREQFKRNIRAALDQEVKSGGPYIEGFNKKGNAESAYNAGYVLGYSAGYDDGYDGYSYDDSID